MTRTLIVAAVMAISASGAAMAQTAPATPTPLPPVPAAPAPPAPIATNPDGSTNARPLGAVANWVALEDLPAAAMTPANAHAVRVRLSVSPLGFVDGCSVLTSSGDTTVDAAVCTALQRNAFFTPAKNPAGQAVPGEFVRNVRWQATAPAPEEPWPEIPQSMLNPQNQ